MNEWKCSLFECIQVEPLIHELSILKSNFLEQKYLEVSFYIFSSSPCFVYVGTISAVDFFFLTLETF